MKFKRKVTLTLESNSPERLNQIANDLFRTRDKGNEKDPEKHVSINATTE